MESYKHKYAKNAVAKRLREQYDKEVRPGAWQVFAEYPVCVDSDNHLRGATDIWAECGEWAPKIPTYQQCIDAELLPLAIFDVVVFYKGCLCAVYEIVHKNDISPEKAPVHPPNKPWIRRLRSLPLGCGVGALALEAATPSARRRAFHHPGRFVGGPMKKLDWALRHAREGFAVFPLSPGSKIPPEGFDRWQYAPRATRRGSRSGGTEIRTST